MKLLRKYIKPIAALLFLNTVYYIAAPSVALALTAGPTAPEYSSFEPVDTTDMVNLATGDLVYNVPLLEVPGPAGGYPLSLSYHAGINPGLEASWVGLGWTLNAGAINRIVNGYPDDYNNTNQTDRFFWEGGSQTTYTLGASYGLPSSAASVGAGLTYASDTYQGVGIGWYVNGGLNVPIGSSAVGKSGIGTSASIGKSPYGDVGFSSGVSLSVGRAISESLIASSSIGLNFGNKGIASNIRGGISYRNKIEDLGTHSVLGSSIGLGGSGSTNHSIGGGSVGIINSKSGNISTKGSSFDLTIPVPVVPGLNIRLGYAYQRYWIDETSDSQTSGSLYFPSTDENNNYFDNKEYDIYDNQGLLESLENGHNNRLKSRSGSFVDYDNYSVVAQGVGGQIKPYIYQAYLNRQNYISGQANVLIEGAITQVNQYSYKNYFLGNNPARTEFRFVGEFSNRLENDGFDFSYNGASDTPLSASKTFDYFTGKTGNDGFANDKLFGSKNIEWFTNEDIANGTAEKKGLIPYRVPFDSRYASGSDRIGAFMVTNESGVTYHFALPVHSRDEYTISKNLDFDGDNFNQLTKKSAYAYTWLLTAVTGPDYVKRGEEYFDGDDFGYWVSFNYGLWTNEFAWRNPSVGYNLDIDNQFESFSKGKKQVYYLDAIKTATHTAVFVKDLRLDGKSTTELINEGVSASNGANRINFFDEGGFAPKQDDNGVYDFPTPSLKLSSILLFQNEDFEGSDIIAKDAGERYLPSGYTYPITGGGRPRYVSFPNEDNVITALDIKPSDKVKAVREIEFDQDYNLMEGTPNSFSNDLYFSSAPSTINSAYERKGKLTLNAIKYNGKGASESLVPPMKFFYEPTDQLNGTADFGFDRRNGGHFFNIRSIGNRSLRIGETFSYKFAGFKYFGVVKSLSGTSGTKVFFSPLGANLRGSSGNAVIPWETSKNPRYQKDFTDIWGSYKHDYSPERSGENMNLAKVTTAESAKNVDAWSLSRIQTSMGSNIIIDYESDDYQHVALGEKSSLVIKSWSRVGQQFTAEIDAGSHDPSELYKIGDQIDVLFTFTKTYRGYDCTAGLDAEVPDTYHSIRDKVNVEAINGDEVTFSSTLISGQIGARYSIGSPSSLDFSQTSYFCRYADVTHGNFEAVSVSLPESDLLTYGGGIRVKSVSYEDEFLKKKHSTHYNYKIPGDPNGRSSGTTSYEPNFLNVVRTDLDENHKRVARKELYKGFEDLLDYSRDIPGPGILYEYVTVSESVTNKTGKVEYLPNHSIYNFRVFNEKMVEINDSSNSTENSYEGVSDRLYVKSVISDVVDIKNLSAAVGALRSITLYSDERSADGTLINSNIISQTQNHYLYDRIESNDVLGDHYLNELENFDRQGVLVESAANARYVERNEGSSFDIYASLVRKTSLPNVAIGQTNHNYKNGGISQTRTLGFDFYSGQPTETYHEDTYNNKFVNVNIPAYRLLKINQLTGLPEIAYPEMGLKSEDDLNKNMLTQEGATYSFKLSDNFDPDSNNDWNLQKESLVGASIQLWESGRHNVMSPDGVITQSSLTNGQNIYRKHGTVSYIGSENINLDGTYDNVNIDSDLTLSSNGLSINDLTGWRKNGEAMLYDVNGHILEVVDINGVYAATKFDSDLEEVYSSASNAGYDEFAFSGAEDEPINNEFGGNVKLNDGVVTSLNSHTGQNALSLPNSGEGFSYVANGSLSTKKYKVSVWTNNPHGTSIRYKINGVLHPLVARGSLNGPVGDGDWYQVSVIISIPEGTSSFEPFIQMNSSGGILDDFMVFPIDAGITAYVYNEWGELSDVINRNNLPTHYEYDAMGRLTSIWTESFQYGHRKVSDTKYHYANQN